MWPNLKNDLMVPVHVLNRHRRAFCRATNLKHPGEKEVLKGLVSQAIRPRVPTKSVESNRMGRDPPPARLRVGKGLILDLDRFRTADALAEP